MARAPPSDPADARPGLIPLRGYGHAQTVAAFTRAQELAGAMSGAPHRFSVFYAVWVALYPRRA